MHASQHQFKKIGLMTAIMTVVALLLLTGPDWVCAGDETPPEPAQKGLQHRIDFGSAHILGQSIKSGAVYLMHRKKSEIKSMLKVRENYREEIIEDYALGKTAIAGISDVKSAESSK
jgi:hypothetical protein